MSDVNKECPNGAGSAELDAEKIANFLVANPDFFEQHSELLSKLKIPHETGQSVSLIERQVAGLRKENAKLKKELHTLIGNARENDQLFEKTQTLITDLLEQDSIETVRQILELSIQRDFSACYCRLWLIAEMPDSGRQQLAATQLKGLIRIMRDKKPYLGEINEAEYRLIFKDCPPEMSSVAVTSLFNKDENLNGVLAIGNSDKDHYQDDMSTELLEFIGRVVARIIDRNFPLTSPK